MTTTAAAAATTTTTTDPAAAAADAFARLAAAWNAADGKAFGAPFAVDADFVDIRGDHHRGRAAIAGGHHAILGSIYAGSTVAYDVEAVRALDERSAVAVVGAALDAPTGPLAGQSASRITAVLVLDEGRWEIAAFQNTLRSA